MSAGPAGEVRAIRARADRPEDALARVNELVAGGAQGIVIVSVDKNGDVNWGTYGLVLRQALTFAAAQMTRDAIEGT